MDNKRVSEKKKELKKHVNAIHSSNNISLVQRKLFNALLFNAYKDLENKTQFTISTRELCNLIGYHSRDYKTLKKALLGLITTAIEWNVISLEERDESSRWNASAIISAASIKRGICTYEFSEIMRELLYYPEIYGRLNMDVQAKFKSTYGLALYENCIRYQGIKHTPWFEMDTFRKLMGVSTNKYKVYSDFKKRIITAAIKEVNSLVSLRVTLEEKRIGRNVEKIRFHFSRTEENLPLKSVELEKMRTVLVDEFALSAGVINDVFKQYEAEYIKEKIDLVLNSNIYQSGRVRELSGFLIKALREDYKKAKGKKTPEVHKVSGVGESAAYEHVDPAREVRRKRAYDKYLLTVTEEFLLRQSSARQKILEEEFAQAIAEHNKTACKWYAVAGIDDERVKAMFYHYLRENYIRQDHPIISEEIFKALIT